LGKGWRDWTGRGGEQAFAGEVARVRASGALAEGGRLRELFDYLAARGPEAGPATQAEIADAVFGQPDTEGDDPTARVYVHRLRKRLEDFYAAEGEGTGGARLVLPAGTYALRLAGPDQEPESPAPASLDNRRWWMAGLGIAAAIVATFLLGWSLGGSGSAPPASSSDVMSSASVP
jgi:hypothetical protein